jgi:hypothetical protein
MGGRDGHERERTLSRCATQRLEVMRARSDMEPLLGVLVLAVGGAMALKR